MDIAGKTIAVCPISLEGAALPPGYDPRPFAQAYSESLLAELARAGFTAHLWEGAEASKMGVSITSRLVRLDPGNARDVLLWRKDRRATFEVEAFVRDVLLDSEGRQVTVTRQIQLKDRAGIGMPWGRNEGGMRKSARDAAFRVVQAMQTPTGSK